MSHLYYLSTVIGPTTASAIQLTRRREQCHMAWKRVTQQTFILLHFSFESICTYTIRMAKPLMLTLCF